MFGLGATGCHENLHKLESMYLAWPLLKPFWLGLKAGSLRRDISRGVSFRDAPTFVPFGSNPLVRIGGLKCFTGGCLVETEDLNILQIGAECF